LFDPELVGYVLREPRADPRNPCATVPALPVDRQELDYLRLDAIEPYLDACMSHYRPLAHFLIGTGARVPEALAVQLQHLALDQGGICRQRGRDGVDMRPTNLSWSRVQQARLAPDSQASRNVS
jgi:integrase